ncbi:MAG: hypothetical protein ACKO96_17390, partial [Flammeovirgaceae bacterium]
NPSMTVIITPPLLDLPDQYETSVRVSPYGDRFIQLSNHWMRLHVAPRNGASFPQLEYGAPEILTLINTGFQLRTYLTGNTNTITD